MAWLHEEDCSELHLRDGTGSIWVAFVWRNGLAFSGSRKYTTRKMMVIGHPHNLYKDKSATSGSLLSQAFQKQNSHRTARVHFLRYVNRTKQV
jgi:hypothetical protein